MKKLKTDRLPPDWQDEMLAIQKQFQDTARSGYALNFVCTDAQSPVSVSATGYPPGFTIPCYMELRWGKERPKNGYFRGEMSLLPHFHQLADAAYKALLKIPVTIGDGKLGGRNWHSVRHRCAPAWLATIMHIADVRKDSLLLLEKYISTAPMPLVYSSIVAETSKTKEEKPLRSTRDGRRKTKKTIKRELTAYEVAELSQDVFAASDRAIDLILKETSKVNRGRGRRALEDATDIKKKKLENLYRQILRLKKPGVGPKKLIGLLKDKKDIIDLAQQSGFPKGLSLEIIKAAITWGDRAKSRNAKPAKWCLFS
jgi:hypothetical protein